MLNAAVFAGAAKLDPLACRVGKGAHSSFK